MPSRCRPGKELVKNAKGALRCKKKCDPAIHHPKRYSTGRCRPMKSLYDLSIEEIYAMRKRTALARARKRLARR